MPSCSPSYRIEWWNPLPGGEWAGRWDIYDEGVLVRAVVLSLFASEEPPELVLLVSIGADGGETARAAVDGAEVEAWDPGVDALPPTSRDASMLPPMGRDDVEIQTLGTCRDALVTAVRAGLLEEEHVAPLVETIQRAFSGTGPSIDGEAA